MWNAIIRVVRGAAMAGLSLALMPWRGGEARAVVFGLMVAFLVYPEWNLSGRAWMREIGEVLSRAFSRKPR